MRTINICAPSHLDIADSYGLLACELARGLTRLGVYVNLFARGERQCSAQDGEVAGIVAQPIRAALGGVMLGYPGTYAKHNGLTQVGPRVAVTMFESSIMPGAWLEPLNQCAAVITPSHFCADVFKDCGVNVPIHVAPLGVQGRYKPAKRPPGRPLTFLAFLDRGKRKGGLVALQAFLDTFGDYESYRLILKGRNVPPARRFSLTNRNVEVIQRDMSEAELYELYLSADVLIFPTKGEGWGLPPREFAATGGIVLATDWSGTADDIDAWGYPLPYKLVPADWSGNSTLEGQDLGEWAEVDTEILTHWLRRIAANRRFYQRRALRNAAAVGELYSWRKFAETVLDVVEGVQSGN